MLRYMFLSMDNQERPETHIGPFLRFVRSSLGLTLRDCANVTHVNFTYLGQVERGERSPSNAWLQAYMEHIGAYLADRELRGAA